MAQADPTLPADPEQAPGLPKDLNICGIPWTVEIVDDPADVDVYRRVPLWGQCIASRREIRIQGGMSPEATFTTLLHELIHAVSDNALGVGDDSREDEQRVTAMASVLADTLIRNNLARLPSR